MKLVPPQAVLLGSSLRALFLHEWRWCLALEPMRLWPTVTCFHTQIRMHTTEILSPSPYLYTGPSSVSSASNVDRNACSSSGAFIDTLSSS